MKFFRSLQAKYMLIIVMAISLVQIVTIIIAIFVQGMVDTMENGDTRTIAPHELEEKWHQEAGEIEKVSETDIHNHFVRWKQKYPEASMFWVNGDGRLVMQLDVKEKLPSKWSSAFTAKFLKERYEGGPLYGCCLYWKK